MTNADLEAAITELGDRVCVIYMDNDHRLLLGYKKGDDSWTPADIQYKTWGGEDFFGFKQKSTMSRDRLDGVTYTVWHRTDCIQAIAAMDEGFENYRMDAFLW